MEWSQIVAYAEAGFTRATEYFRDRPSGFHFNALLRSALVHQQVRMCPNERHKEVLEAAMGCMMKELDDTLVRVISGRTIDEVLGK